MVDAGGPLIMVFGNAMLEGEGIGAIRAAGVVRQRVAVENRLGNGVERNQ